MPVTTGWRVHRLRMEERSPIWRIAANILNKQWRTADKGWSSCLGGVGDKVTNPRLKNIPCYELFAQTGTDGRILLRWIFRKFDVGV